MPGPGINDKAYLNVIPDGYKAFNVEVAVAYTDKTWDTVVVTIEDKPVWLVAKVGEARVLEAMADHPTKVVSFAKTIWMGPEPTEDDMVETIGDEEEIT